jgi:hypothetical protein
MLSYILLKIQFFQMAGQDHNLSAFGQSQKGIKKRGTIVFETKFYDKESAPHGNLIYASKLALSFSCDSGYTIIVPVNGW